MPDATVTVGELRERVRRFVAARDWERFHNPKDVAMALSIEASELLERFLWREPPAPPAMSAEDREGIADEMADVLVFALILADAMGIDVSDALASKLVKNEARYPADRFMGVAP